MKPYGWKKHMWSDEDGGPTTKHTGIGFHARRVHRRILHKTGRRMSANEVVEQSKPLLPHEDLFVCKNCGDVSQECDRCQRTGECIWC